MLPDTFCHDYSIQFTWNLAVQDYDIIYVSLVKQVSAACYLFMHHIIWTTHLGKYMIKTSSTSCNYFDKWALAHAYSAGVFIVCQTWSYSK